MATPAQIEQQVELERRAIRQGTQRLWSNTFELEQKSYASASIYGVTCIQAMLPKLVSYIDETAFARIQKGDNGLLFAEINAYLLELDTYSMAAIALKIAFDKIFSHKANSNLVTEVISCIGAAVEQECQMRWYEKTDPNLLQRIKENYWHQSSGTRQRLATTKTLMNRYEKEWQHWSRTVRTKLGGWLLDCLCQVSGWFTKVVEMHHGKRQNCIVPTPEFYAVKDQIMGDAEGFAPLAWPMLIEPNDWSPAKPGGYLLNEVMRGHQMVRRGDQGCVQGEGIYAFLNHLQKVAYKVNPFTYGVALQLMERGIQVGKFIPIYEVPKPPKPSDIAENYDSRKDYRRRTAEAMNQQAQVFRKSCRTRMTMEVAGLFATKDRFFLPWSTDYRGRAYPIPAFLTPQDTDFGKSLLRFAEEAFLTPESEDWLKFQVATTYGLDKSTLQDRLDWADNNHALISRVATDPLANIGDWEAAEEPWQFLAACEEMHACLLACTRSFTGLCIATDATCSGLQILAGLARDASTARLVNVLPSDCPQDAYKVVAEAAKPHCPESIQPYMDRKTVKRVVMTVPYNAKPYSNRGYIREALKDKDVEIEKDDLTQTVRAVREAMERVVPGPMKVMRWIEDEVSAAIKAGKTKLTWTTPSGFVVNQKLMKPNKVRIQLQLLGSCDLLVADGDTNEVDINRHKAATAPNLIHSLDASILHLSFIRFDAPFSVIHDSVLCRATDMSQLSTVVRETYMHIFAEHDYLRDFAAQIGAETEPPIIGDLEPEAVINSTYFFC